MTSAVGLVIPKQAGRLELLQEQAREHPRLALSLIDPDLPVAQLDAACAEHELLILGTRVPMETLLRCPRLRFVQLMAAGFDTFDIPELARRGVRLANSSAAIAVAVAEHTITLMLVVKHRLLESWNSVQTRQWMASVQADRIGELTGCTVGLIGLGHIGREVARRLQGWEPTLLYSDLLAASAETERELGTRRVGLDELLAQSDVISLHVPLNAATRGLIGRDALSRVRPAAILINTCRGSVVDEPALIDALREGRLAGAGLDVLEQEPPATDNPLLAMPNVVVTPHIAGSTAERVKRATVLALDNVERVIAGQEPLSLVRP